MKVALLISGYLRSFKENYENLHSHVLSKFDNVDVYIHLTKDGDKKDRYLNFNDDVDTINNILNPKCLLCEDNFTLSKDSSINNTLNLWFKYYKLNELKKKNELINGKYDLVIKWRPDLNISQLNFIIDKFIYIPSDSKIDKSKLIHQDDNYICDIFAYGSSELMDDYFNIYTKLNDLIIKYNTHISETLLFNYLYDYNIRYKLIDVDYSIILSKCNIFAIAGDSGSGKTTLGNLLKKYFDNSFMLECDRYHKWERENENWKNFTHLNPEANYLAKMNEDIFDLKVGNTIYQVNYDHKNGKFTEPEKIDSSDNIVVCGLHSLYNDDENIYNLKIFLDTDTDLKYFWKIKRDTEKRGYSMEKILKQIEHRKEDYIKYIEPQKEISDVIINFFTEDILDYNLLNVDYKIKLRILISSKYDISSILSELNKENIKYEVYSSVLKYNSIIFHEYTEHSLQFQNKNYYDYILLILLNLTQKI